MATVAVPGSPHKAGVYFDRYLALVRWLQDHGQGVEAEVALEEVAATWDCSTQAAQQTLRRLAGFGLLRWQPGLGRGHRSRLRLQIHPAHVDFARARQAEARGALAEAAFWLSEINRERPRLTGVPALLAGLRRPLGLRPTPCC